MEHVLQQVADFLYTGPGGKQTFTVAEIQAALNNISAGDLHEAIRLMHKNSLLRIALAGDLVELVLKGKTIREKGCVSEVCLGGQFIAQKYRSAVHHIVARDGSGDEGGGCAFFCEDFPGWMVTARHLVADGRILLRVEDESGLVISNGPFQIRLAGADLDLALLECSSPAGVTPLRIDWDRTAVKELDEVMVVGYPPIAQHAPALVFSEGQVASIPKHVKSLRNSVIISKVTEPGYSGGPVLSAAGLVVGVIEQENIFETKAGLKSVFNGATPSHYFSEF
jgi:hypothetical protein